MNICDNCGHQIPDRKEIHTSYLISYYVGASSIVPLFCSQHCMNWYMTSKLNIPESEIKGYNDCSDLNDEWKEFRRKDRDMKKRGQGIIEYAGALIVAAMVVASVLLVGTDGFTNLYNTIFSSVSAMLLDGLKF